MSYVTDVVVVSEYVPEDMRPALTAPWPFDERQQALREIDTDGAGGTKFMGSMVYAAGANYLDVEAFREWVRALPWRYAAVVYIRTEDMDAEMLVVGDNPRQGWLGR